LQIGDKVKVHALSASDGSQTAAEIKLASEAASSDDSASDQSSTGSELEFTGNVESLDAGLWTVSGLQFVITGQTEVKGLISLGDLVKVHASIGSDGTLTAREIELAGVDEQANLGRVEFTGTLDSLLDNGWVVGGQTVLRTPETEVKGDLQLGDMVKVEGAANPDGTFSAREISKAAAGNDSLSGSDSSGSGSGHGSDDGTSQPGSDDGRGHDSGDASGGGGGGGGGD
jgi:hypothetical protein